MTKFAFVSAERASHAVATLCRVVGVSVSGFYAWLRAIPTVQARGRPMTLEGHDQGVGAQPGFQVIRHRPAEDLARGPVLDRRQMEPALVRRNV